MSQASLWGAAEGTHLRRRFDRFGAQGTDLYTLVGVHVLKTKGSRAEGRRQHRFRAGSGYSSVVGGWPGACSKDWSAR